jgi:hypothetical protein
MLEVQQHREIHEGIEMVTLVESVRINKDQTVKTDAGEFYVCQRNEGFVNNDGRWLVKLLPNFEWSPGGAYIETRPGRDLGNFLTPVDVIEAIESAAPEADHPQPVYV